MEPNEPFSDDDHGHKIKKKIKTEENSLHPNISSEDKEEKELFEPNYDLPTDNPLIINHPPNLFQNEIPIANFQARTENAVGFYSDKREISKTERDAFLATSDLRNFHNWIKSVIIKKYSDQMKQLLSRNHIKGKISVMEVGCGQGGDLIKWAHAGIGSFIGLDVANLEKTKNRYSEIAKGGRFRDVYRAGFLVQSGENSPTEFYREIDPELYFDIISCQFSLHYMFGSNQSVQNLFTNLTKKLVDQGLIICTIPDSNVIVKRFRKHGKKIIDGDYIVGNKYYSMKMAELNFPPNKIYGLKYLFYLEDAVGLKVQNGEEEPTITYVPEYLIEFQNFVKVAKDYGLEIVEERNFLDFYKENREGFRHLFPVMKLKYAVKESMDPQLWEISHLYKVVVLRKKGGKQFDKIERRFNDIQQGYYEVEKQIFK